MGAVVRLEVEQHRHAIEQTLFGLTCETQALARLANEGGPFFRAEIADMRRAAYDLLQIAQQAEANITLGSK